MSAGWSARVADDLGEQLREGRRARPRQKRVIGFVAVPRLGRGPHGGEAHVPRPAPLEQLDHEPERRRRVDPAGAGAAADLRLVGDLGAGGDVGVAVGLVVVADDGQVVQAVLAAWEQVAEDARLVVLLAHQLDLHVAGVPAIDQLLRDVRQRPTLRSLGLADDASIDLIVGDALDDAAIRNSPRLPTSGEARAILESVAG